MQDSILVIHGPNLNLLGNREKSLYGDMTLDQINERLNDECQKLGRQLSVFQSNSEAEIINRIQQAESDHAGIIINPAAFTHSSIAIRDAIAAISLPVVEVHLTNTSARDSFRRHSMVAPVVKGTIQGFGWYGYVLALYGLNHQIK